jgi:hypothetical protein
MRGSIQQLPGGATWAQHAAELSNDFNVYKRISTPRVAGSSPAGIATSKKSLFISKAFLPVSHQIQSR